MKRETIEAICKKLGIPLAPDDDPRYSEPVSITLLSHTDPGCAESTSGGARPALKMTPEQVTEHNLRRLATFDAKAAAERSVKQVEANLRDAAERARLREEGGDAPQ